MSPVEAARRKAKVQAVAGQCVPMTHRDENLATHLE